MRTSLTCQANKLSSFSQLRQFLTKRWLNNKIHIGQSLRKIRAQERTHLRIHFSMGSWRRRGISILEEAHNKRLKVTSEATEIMSRPQISHLCSLIISIVPTSRWPTHFLRDRSSSVSYQARINSIKAYNSQELQLRAMDRIFSRGCSSIWHTPESCNDLVPTPNSKILMHWRLTNPLVW